jgi:isopenicillin N synthase-like dioxygenase
VAPNRWPNLPGFQRALEELYSKMAEQTAMILGALEEGLHVPSGTLNSHVNAQRGASELRLNHYPETSSDILRSGRVSRIWPHFDLGVVTLLFSTSLQGLEVEDRPNGPETTFIPVEPESSFELIVNISETLQRWTNDRLPAGLHRVQMPREIGEATGVQIPSRYSVAYFCKADRDAPAGTLPAFTENGKAKYENITASEYHRQRLVQAY